MSGEGIYVIGNRGNGVVLLRMNPLRVVVIEDSEIKRFSEKNNTDGYAKLASALWKLTADLRGKKIDNNTDASAGIETIVSNGVKLTEVDFVYAVHLAPDDAGSGVDAKIDIQMDAKIDIQMDAKIDIQMDSQIDSQMPTELPSWVTFYSPASDAIGRLFVKDGENLQNAVLSDVPSTVTK